MAKSEITQASPRGTGIAVVERAVLVLQVVVAADTPLGLRELGRRTSLPPPTTLRLVRTLQGLGLLERLADGSIRPGPGVQTLVPSSSPGIPVATLDGVLRRIVDVFGEGATAGIEDGDNTLFTAHVAAPSAVQVADIAGDRWPMHATASGIVLMASWPQRRLDSYLAGPLPQPTPLTQTDPAIVRQRLSEVRQLGYAWSLEEATLETCGLAVPIIDSKGEVAAAVGLYGPLYRLTPQDKELGGRLAELVNDLAPASAKTRS